MIVLNEARARAWSTQSRRLEGRQAGRNEYDKIGSRCQEPINSYVSYLSPAYLIHLLLGLFCYFSEMDVVEFLLITFQIKLHHSTSFVFRNYYFFFHIKSGLFWFINKAVLMTSLIHWLLRQKFNISFLHRIFESFRAICNWGWTGLRPPLVCPPWCHNSSLQCFNSRLVLKIDNESKVFRHYEPANFLNEISNYEEMVFLSVVVQVYPKYGIEEVCQVINNLSEMKRWSPNSTNYL